MTYFQTYFKKGQGNKYHNIKQTYNGHTYHSKLEAEYAFGLDMLLRKGEIKAWTRQVKVELNFIFKNLDGENVALLTDTPALELKKSGQKFIHVGNYYVDFKIEHKDDTIEYVECKGMELPVGVMKMRMLEALCENDPIKRFAVVK